MTELIEMIERQRKRKDRIQTFMSDIGWGKAPDRLRRVDIPALADTLEHYTADEIAQWIVEAFGDSR